MPDNDIFNDDNKQKQLEVTPPSSNQEDLFNDKLNKIKTEDGTQKYKDVATALDALVASQSFIETLKSEKTELANKLAEAEAKASQAQNIEDLLSRINPDYLTNPNKSTDKQGLSVEQVNQLLEDTLTSREVKIKQGQNLQSVVDKLSQLYGDKAGERIKQRAGELGTTTDALRDIARTNPKMALELLVEKPSVKSVTPSRSEILSPQQVSDDNPTPKWERGAARGGLSNSELVDRWRQVKDYTNKRIGVETN